eukprot:7383398-Prymnesium_polylepis.2
MHFHYKTLSQRGTKWGYLPLPPPWKGSGPLRGASARHGHHSIGDPRPTGMRSQRICMRPLGKRM